MKIKIKDYKVVPVAGYDSMLLTLSGAHSPYFTRNIVIIEDELGNIGIGETHGGRKVESSLNSYKENIIGKNIFDYKNILNYLEKSRNKASSEGIQYLDISKLTDVVNDLGAVECALLDLVGKNLNLPMNALIGEGKQRNKIPILAYMFFVGDKDKTDLPYLDESDSQDEWFRLRRKEMLNLEQMDKQLSVLHKKYGFVNFKLKGGVLSGVDELEILKGLKDKYPEYNFNIDPNGAWSAKESLEYIDKYNKYMSYFEDPSSGEYGYSGREISTELKVKTNVKLATNMIATDWRQLYHALSQKSIDIVLADPHFWTISGSIRCSQILNDFNLIWGSHSNNHFDISLAMFAQTAAAAVGEITPVDTHWIWQDGQNITKNSYKINEGYIDLSEDRPGLGVEIDFEKLEEANKLYNSLEERFLGRDDSIAMQYLIENWKFDSKKPCLVR